MLIRLIPLPPHPSVLYGLSFPSVIPLHDFSPSATLPAAWSSQMQILTSVLQLEPPSSIHMLDRAVGLVARVYQVSMDILQKEIEVRFIDGQVMIIPMDSDCVRMLSGVAVDVKACSEPESQRNSIEGSACHESTAGSTEDLPPGSSPTKSPKSRRHKRQRSLLFSLISSLVPKSLSLSLPPRPLTAPPPAPLPPLPVACSVTSPVLLQQTMSASVQLGPEIFLRRARATLVDAWRRHVIPALTPQHLPPAGYIEWTLMAMASTVRAEIEFIETTKSHGFGVSNTRAGRNRHRKTQSEGRNAFDFGDRMNAYESEQWRCRPPSPFPDMLNAEDTDRVVYPRREQEDEWGVRHVHDPRSSDEAEVFSVKYNGHNDNLLDEHLSIGDDWDDDERLTLELGRMTNHDIPGTCNFSFDFEGRHLHPADFGLDYSDDDDHRLVDTAFDVSRCPLIPSNVNDDEESDDGQTSVRTPEDGEDLLLVSSAQRLQGSTRHATCSAPQSSLVSRASSSRPRSRIVSAQYSNAPSTPIQAFHPPSSFTSTSLNTHSFDCRDTQADELITSYFIHLERISTALEIVRSRAREEGWSLVRATSIGGKNGWSDPETERSLEIKAKRRAWSSGVKVSAPYSTSRFAWRMCDGSLSTLRSSSMRPPGLASRLTEPTRVRGPIVPTGLSLGMPVQSSPLAMYAWGAENGQNSTHNKYGILSSVRNTETMDGKRSSRVTFADSITKLFPVCEDDEEDSFEPVQDSAVGFPYAGPLDVSAEESKCDVTGELAENEDDPFYFCPSQPRKRTTSMSVVPPTLSVPSSPVLPTSRCSTPSLHNQAAIYGEVSATANDEEGRLDASVPLLRSLSSSASSSSQSPLSLPPLTSNSPFVPRPRAVSLPILRSYSSMNQTCRTPLNHKDEHCKDLSRVYASPPPGGPLVISATPAPHEQHPRYAHVCSPIPASKKRINASIPGRTGKEVVFERAGSEFTVGMEVALGRAEEGRVVWGARSYR